MLRSNLSRDAHHGGNECCAPTAGGRKASRTATWPPMMSARTVNFFVSSGLSVHGWLLGLEGRLSLRNGRLPQVANSPARHGEILRLKRVALYVEREEPCKRKIMRRFARWMLVLRCTAREHYWTRGDGISVTLKNTAHSAAAHRRLFVSNPLLVKFLLESFHGSV